MPTPKPVRARLSLALLATAALVAGAGGFGTSVRTDVTLPLGAGGSVRIGAIRPGAAPWSEKPWGAALAAVGTVTLHDVTVTLGDTTYGLPTLAFTGLSLSQADAAALFDRTAAEPLPARLARLSAQGVAIPELTVTQRVGGETRVTTYRDVAARDLVNGRVASLTGAGATIAVTGRRAVAGTTGRLTIEDLDLAQAARLYETRSDAAAAPLTRVYGAFALEDMALQDAGGPQVRIARIGGRDFSARPTQASWGETLTLLGQHGGKPDQAPPVDRARLVAALADLLDAFQIGELEATGLETRDASAPGGVRVARMAYAGAAGDKPADLRVEEVEIAADGGRARLGLIGFTGFSFQSTVQGLRALGDKPLADLDPADLRALVPTIGTVRLSGLDFDLPGKTETPKAENIRFAVRDVELTADKPVNGIPSDLRLAVQNVAVPIPAGTAENGLKDLAAMGYRALDLSLTASAAWNEPGSELVLREVSVSGADMGRATVRGVLGGVGRDAFNPDSAVALVALVGATAKSLDLTLENKGLFERALADAAKKQKRSPDDLRREYGMAAAIAVPAVLGPAPAARTLGQAVARFIAKPGRIAVSARTKDPAGLGIADLAALGEAPAILDKLEVTATAD